jgi:hypothetical protein
LASAASDVWLPPAYACESNMLFQSFMHKKHIHRWGIQLYLYAFFKLGATRSGLSMPFTSSFTPGKIKTHTHTHNSSSDLLRKLFALQKLCTYLWTILYFIDVSSCKKFCSLLLVLLFILYTFMVWFRTLFYTLISFLLFLTSLHFILWGNTLMYDIHFLFIHHIHCWKRGRPSTYQNVWSFHFMVSVWPDDDSLSGNW